MAVLLTIAAAAGAAARHIPVVRQCCLRRRAAAGAGTDAGDSAAAAAENMEEGAVSLRDIRSKDKFSNQGISMQTQSEGLSIKKLVIDGKGIALATTPIDQDKCLFEVLVLNPGSIAVGVCRFPQPEEFSSFSILSSKDRCWMASLGGEEGPAIEAGDVIGCAVDQSDTPARVAFFLNGICLSASAKSGIRGEVWPAVFITDGACVEFAFSGERLRYLGMLRERGYKPLMASRNLL